MSHVDRPATPGQDDDPRPWSRSTALMLTNEEAQRVRTAIRKVAATCGGFPALAIKLGIPTATLYYAANPKGRPSGMMTIRLAAVAKVPVEVLLTGKLAVSLPVIGVAA
jgi:hypothetical protein